MCDDSPENSRLKTRTDKRTRAAHAGAILSLAGILRMGAAHLFDVSTFRSVAEAAVSFSAVLAASLLFFAGGALDRRLFGGVCRDGRSSLHRPFLLLWLDAFHLQVGRLASLGTLALIAALCLFLYRCSAPLCIFWEKRGAPLLSRYSARLGLVERHCDRMIAFALTVLFFLFYYATRYPGIGGRIHYGDSAEFQLLSYLTGISHPSGYPLYFMLVRALKHVLFFLPRYQFVTLVSVFFGALTIGFTYLSAVKFSGSRLGSVVSATLLGVSLTFWCLATEAEVYALNSFFIAAVTYFTICFGLTRRYRSLYIGMFLYALGFGNHLTVLFLLPGILYLLIKVEPSFFRNHRAMLIIGGFVLIGAGTYLYLYILANHFRLATHNTLGQNPSLSEVFRWATASQYHNEMFAYRGAELLSGKAMAVVHLLVREFTIVGLFALVAGVVIAVVATRHATILYFLLISLFSHAFFAVNYNIPDFEVLFPTVYFYLVVLSSTLFANKRALLCKLSFFVFLISYLIYNNGINYGVANTSNDAYFRVKEAFHGPPSPHPVFVGTALTNYHTSYMLTYLTRSKESAFKYYFPNSKLAGQNGNTLYTEEARRQLYPGERTHHPIGGVLFSDYVAANRNHLMLWVTQDIQQRWWNKSLVDAFTSLGSKLFKGQMPKKPHVGISLGGKMVFETSGEGHRLAVDEGDVPELAERLEHLEFELVSTTYGLLKQSYAGPYQGARSSIEVFGKAYGKGIEGINVVVVDLHRMKVLSSKNFNVNKGNVYASDTMFVVRKPMSRNE